MKHDEYMKIGHSMLGVSRRFKAFMRGELQSIGINFNEGITLLSLYGNESQSADKLLETVSCDKSVMTRTLQKLETDGMVLRIPNPDDGRSWLFSVTDTGKKNAGLVLSALQKWSETAFAGLTEKETTELLRLLMKL